MDEFFIYDLNMPLVEIMKKINMNSKGMVYVVTLQKKLIGVITDGDIRRKIVETGCLDLVASDVLHAEAVSLLDADRDRAEKIMKELQIRSIPIVDENGLIKEIRFLDNEDFIPSDKIAAPVVIMAGGKGTRLLPYTQVLPKPLIPIGAKTITEHIIDRFADAGCNRFTMIVNYKKNIIKAYFKDLGMDTSIEFVDEEKFAGTAGGLRLIKGKIKEAFFMTNCDILVEGNYAELMRFHKEKHNIATLVCAVKNMKLSYGVIESTHEGRVKAIREKPLVSSLVNTGLYVLEPEFLDRLSDNEIVDITEVFQQCIANGDNVGMYPISESRWMDMGQMDELEKMRERLVR